jgi:hypothetical protein
MDQITTNPVVAETRHSERKPYQTPTLTDFGSFADITQGAAGAPAGDNTIYS